jgi:hypothetical protein
MRLMHTDSLLRDSLRYGDGGYAARLRDKHVAARAAPRLDSLIQHQLRNLRAWVWMWGEDVEG